MSARGRGETTTAERQAAGAEPEGGPLWRLLNGQANIDFIGRSRLWLWVVLATAAVSLGALAARGLNFNIDFTGGTAFTVNGATRPFTSDRVGDALGQIGLRDTRVQVVDDGRGALVSTPALDEIGGRQQREVVQRLSEITGAPPDQIDVSAVGPRWGAQITRQALRGLAVFLVLIVVYISLRFEWRMAASALVTLLHDILLTVGVYALVGFEVSPASVIAFLTILGYSLYDTVVVFDRVTEDTERLSSVSTVTYGESANRALNEVLVRSLSTSATSILPVGSLLFIGANLLGADTLQDLALALFVGMAVGTYSSIIVATPFLVWLKEREPRYAELKQRLAARRGAEPASAAQASR
ncbi:MAG: protein translocase subunit SecF, partial [Actinomycetota bacterium]|nr:protein translocase subunit SecF [Actinomycetota bacterium]